MRIIIIIISISHNLYCEDYVSLKCLKHYDITWCIVIYDDGDEEGKGEEEADDDFNCSKFQERDEVRISTAQQKQL